MGKLARASHSQTNAAKIRRLRELRATRRKLAARMQEVDAALAKLAPSSPPNSSPTPEQLDQWFDQISEGLPDLPALPADFSRADLYDDHD